MEFKKVRESVLKNEEYQTPQLDKHEIRTSFVKKKIKNESDIFP